MKRLLGERLYRGDDGKSREGVEMKDGLIKSIRTESGNVYRARYFIDVTYEGDLMAAAGVAYRVGREDCSEFGETWNGNQVGILHHRHHFGDMKISPYKIPGDPKSGLLPEIGDSEPGVRGKGDRRVQAYCYRLCMTDNDANRIPFSKPDGYDPARYELIARVYATGWDETFVKFDRIANFKTDTNNHGPLSADYIGANYDWPEASYARRAELAKAHRDYQMGFYYFVANDPSIPEHVRKRMSKWGLAKDEFTDNGGWPWQIYVREGRRMVGEYVMTEHDCLRNPLHAAQVVTIHDDKEVVVLVVPRRHLPRRFACAGDAHLGQLAACAVGDPVADLLAADGGRGDLEIIAAACFGCQIFHDKLSHGASADVAVANKKDLGHCTFLQEWFLLL